MADTGSFFSGEAIASLVGSFVGVLGAFGASWYGLRKQLGSERKRWAHARFVEGGVEPILELISTAKAQIDDYLAVNRVTQIFDVKFDQVHFAFYRVKRHLESLGLWEAHTSKDPLERKFRDLVLALKSTTAKWENVSIPDSQWGNFRKTLVEIKEYFASLEALLEEIEKTFGREESKELLAKALKKVSSSALNLGHAEAS